MQVLWVLGVSTVLYLNEFVALQVKQAVLIQSTTGLIAVLFMGSQKAYLLIRNIISSTGRNTETPGN